MSRATGLSKAGLEQGDGGWAGRQHSRVAAQQGDGASQKKKKKKTKKLGDGASQNEDGAVEIGGATQDNGDGTARQRHTRGDGVVGYGRTTSTASQNTEERRRRRTASQGRRRATQGDRKALAADGSGVAGQDGGAGGQRRLRTNPKSS